jgi:hypothetical protein
VTLLAANRPPGTPTISAGTTTTLKWGRTSDPDAGDYVDYYWIYRDGAAYANRYDIADNDVNPIQWADPDPTGGPHTYRVTAVDSHGNESTFSGTVSR